MSARFFLSADAGKYIKTELLPQVRIRKNTGQFRQWRFMVYFVAMKSSIKRIVVAFQLAGEPGRRKLDGFFRYMLDNNLNWQLQFVRHREDFSAEFVQSFHERGIDGIVFSLPSARDGGMELTRLEIPTVALDVYDNLLSERKRNLIMISGSCESVGREAARHFLSQGLYRSYAFVPALSRSQWSRLRGKAFIAEMKRNGFDVSVYRAGVKGYDLPKLRDWVGRLPKPAGVFAAFDDRAIQVLEACRDASLEVPNEIAVIGVDNDEQLCPRTTPPLTSVCPDHERIGALAAEKLHEMLEGRELSVVEHVEIDAKGIAVRESTSPVSMSGKLVQRALAFIRAHYAEPISSCDVAKQLRVSRRLADLRFREIQGESIGKAILHTRLEAVRHRLTATNDSMENIAAVCGFNKLSRMREYFKAYYGMSVQECRNLNKNKGEVEVEGEGCR